MLLRPKRMIFVIFGLAIVLRFALFAYLVDMPRKFYFYDSNGYVQRAQNLLQYGVFADEAEPPFTPDLERTPGYPLMLASIFALMDNSVQVAILIQVVLSSITVVLTFWLCNALNLPASVALLAALIVAIDPLSISTTNYLLTETVFTMLLVAGIGCLVQFWRAPGWWWLLLSAVLLALSSLTRPISQFLPLVLLPLFALPHRWPRRRVGIGLGLVFVLISLALTYTWAVRNYRATGLFTLSTISDTNLIFYRARDVLASATKRGQDETWRQLEMELEQQAEAMQLTMVQRVHLQRQKALAIFRQYPSLTLIMTLKGAGRLLSDPGYTVVCTQLDRSTTGFDCFPGKATMNEPGLVGKALSRVGSMSHLQKFLLAWSTLLLLGVYPAALLGCLHLFRERHWLPLMLLGLLIIYFVGLSAGAEATSRFRVPLMPFIAMLSGTGLVITRTRYTRRVDLPVAKQHDVAPLWVSRVTPFL